VAVEGWHRPKSNKALGRFCFNRTRYLGKTRIGQELRESQKPGLTKFRSAFGALGPGSVGVE
jgi:hypothetical protein